MEEQDYILFEDYVSGTLSEEEKQKLEERLRYDDELKESLTLYKEASAYLDRTFGKLEDTETFRNKVSDISKEYFLKDMEPRKGLRKLKLWQIAVAASVLVILGIFFSRRISIPVYEDYADYPQLSLAMRGEGNTLLQQAETAFNAGDYEKASVLFEDILKADGTNAEISLYYAVSLVELGRYEEADTGFSALMDSRSVFRTEAMWYRALSKLKQKDYEACAGILEQVPEDTDRYAEAQKLLKRLPE
ncbi:tetratricopeptide repeat protein [Sinomicrobium sp. M5D2P17]